MFRKYKVLDPTLQLPEDCSLEGDIVVYFILKIHYPPENLLTSTKNGTNWVMMALDYSWVENHQP